MMQSEGCRALILAAGKGTRMKSEKSKVVHEILGKAIVQYVVDALIKVPVREIAVIVGEHNIDEVKKVLGDQVEYIIQKEQKGTGHAVLSAESWLYKNNKDVFILVGDAPFISTEILQDLYELKKVKNYSCTLLSSEYENPPPYGRIVRNNKNEVMEIVEEKDASESQKLIKEVSSSHYCFSSQELLDALKKTNNQNAQSEYYLPDVIKLFYQSGQQVETVQVKDPFQTFGINDPNDMEKGIAYLKHLKSAS